jgi:predicted transcriptional regulator
LVALKEWQIEETRTAVARADTTDFATDEEVAGVIKKWTGRAR